MTISTEPEEDEQFKDLRGYDQLNPPEKRKVKNVIQKYTKHIKTDPAIFGEIKAIVENASTELGEDDFNAR